MILAVKVPEKQKYYEILLQIQLAHGPIKRSSVPINQIKFRDFLQLRSAPQLGSGLDPNKWLSQITGCSINRNLM
jgi:hypothetical protein